MLRVAVVPKPDARFNVPVPNEPDALALSGPDPERFNTEKLLAMVKVAEPAAPPFPWVYKFNAKGPVMLRKVIAAPVVVELLAWIVALPKSTISEKVGLPTVRVKRVEPLCMNMVVVPGVPNAL